jgi:hypothetical protein
METLAEVEGGAMRTPPPRLLPLPDGVRAASFGPRCLEDNMPSGGTPGPPLPPPNGTPPRAECRRSRPSSPPSPCRDPPCITIPTKGRFTIRSLTLALGMRFWVYVGRDGRGIVGGLKGGVLVGTAGGGVLRHWTPTSGSQLERDFFWPLLLLLSDLLLSVGELGEWRTRTGVGKTRVTRLHGLKQITKTKLFSRQCIMYYLNIK